MRKNFYCIIILNVLLGFQTAFGQDPAFTQYYSAPLYQNPAFAGTTPHHRVAFNHRNQWSSLPKAFVTYAVGYDLNVKNSNSNFGFLATTDKAGEANLRSSNLGAIYSYAIPMTNKMVVVPGLHVSYTWQSLDYSKLVFGDQLHFGDPDAPSLDPSAYSFENQKYFDFNTGVLLYNEKFWGGFSLHHLNKPKHSFLGEESSLPIKTSVHAGLKIPINLGAMKRGISSSINPSFNYKHQGKFDQLDLGLNYQYQMLTLGAWYKGIPILQETNDHINHDAIAVVFGVSLNDFSFAYSYDLTVSKLGPASSGGSHEIALIFQFETKRSPKHVSRKEKFTPCPAFTPKFMFAP